MKLTGAPVTIDWPAIPAVEQPGASGFAVARTCRLADTQIRSVSYSANYMADHWCHKGHIVLVLAGDVTIEHENGSKHVLKAGMSYCVGDNEASPHRLLSVNGASVFIVD